MSTNLAQDWFNAFFDKFVRTRQEDPKFGFNLSRPEWTRQMIQFLKELGEEKGYKVQTEGGHGRFDLFWHRDDTKIAIEHEINQRNIVESELQKLMNVSSDLKVLVTYVRDYNLTTEPEVICAKIRKELNRNVRHFKDLLLIIGTKSPGKRKEEKRTFMERETDWFARRFYVGAVRMEILRPSGSFRAMKAWETPKKGEEPKDALKKRE